MSNGDYNLARAAEDSVQKVITRIADAFSSHGYTPAPDLEDAMAKQYVCGFRKAHAQVRDFWGRFGETVLRMAGYVGALACFFVEREDAKNEEKSRVVTERHWLMAMGVVRSACLAGAKGLQGLPCNRANFALQEDTKVAVVQAFAAILADLMTPDPDPEETNAGSRAV